MPGCHATPFQGHLLTTATRESSFAPSYHMVTDLGTDEAWTNLPGGPSENRFSKWYKVDIPRGSPGTTSAWLPAAIARSPHCTRAVYRQRLCRTTFRILPPPAHIAAAYDPAIFAAAGEKLIATLADHLAVRSRDANALNWNQPADLIRDAKQSLHTAAWPA